MRYFLAVAAFAVAAVPGIAGHNAVADPVCVGGHVSGVVNAGPTEVCPDTPFVIDRLTLPVGVLDPILVVEVWAGYPSRER